MPYIQHHGIQFTSVNRHELAPPELSVAFIAESGEEKVLPMFPDGTVIVLPLRKWTGFRVARNEPAEFDIELSYELLHPVETVQNIPVLQKAGAMKFNRGKQTETAAEKRKRGSLFDLGGH